jgi:hypothetical protein
MLASPRIEAGVCRIPVRGLEKASMNRLKNIAEVLFAATLIFLFSATTPASAQTSSAPANSEVPQTSAPLDGQHDFDFNLGSWNTHIRRLARPLTGSTTWTELNGTVVIRQVWDGRAEFEEIKADGPSGHFEGLTLFLYNPQSHQWSMSFANSSDGAISQPSIGEFKNGRGEFYDQESYKGRTILVRIVWSDITADSHHFEQSFSDDGGKTWEPNFTATLTREKP